MRRSRSRIATRLLARSSGALLSLTLLTACPVVVPLSTGRGGSPAGTCDFFGTHFVKPAGWSAEEKRETSEPIPRVTLSGGVGTHQILLSIIPRELRSSAAADKAGQADAYFRGLRSALPDWTDVSQDVFDPSGRGYPVLFGTALVKGLITTQQDNVVLLYFPDHFPKGRYFYVFFWTDIHTESARPVALDELRGIVESFEITSSPLGAASKGCAA